MACPEGPTDTGGASCSAQPIDHGPLPPSEASCLPDIKPCVEGVVRQVGDRSAMLKFSLDGRVSSGAGPLDPRPTVVSSGAAREVLQMASIVLEGRNFLETISPVLTEHADKFPELSAWVKQIGKLRELNKAPQLKIGLYGITGAGKSTLINALLDRKLLHCNAMRAGTAVITEIMYIDDDIYRGEIELISVEEWKEELKVLLSDLEEFSTSDSFPNKISDPAKHREVASAWAKVKAVYPHLDFERVVKMSVSEVLAQKDLQEFIGATKVFEDKSLKRFSRALKQYTNGTSQESMGCGQEQISCPFWPFVKRATIKLKASALQTGVVLYDLPGCGDTNAARTRIAEDFLKNLDHIWVLADINRACDDEVAKQLLGAPFRRQLKMDGNYNDEYVSFIMTKTDNITTGDVIDDLDLHDQLRMEQAQIKKLSKIRCLLAKQINAKSRPFKENQTKQQATTNQIKARCDRSRSADLGWQDFKALSDRDLRSLKRKRGDDNDEPANLPSPKIDESRNKDRQCLGNRDHSRPQISSLVAEREDICQFQERRKKSIDSLLAERDKTNHELKELQIKLKKICIAKRNEYAIDRIREDFETGQNDCEREFADSDDKEAFSTSSNVATRSNKLQVFAVSSKTYLMLSGRMKDEPDSDGLYSTKDTSIPALQEHCRSITLKRREQSAFRYVKALGAMQTEMKEWIQDQSEDKKISPEQRARLKELLGTELTKLRIRISDQLEILIERYRAAVTGEILKGMRRSVQCAAITAKTTVKSWTASGMAHGTWKAICVRLGIFQNSKKFRYDWNEELAEPFFAHFQGPWNETFNNLLPELKKSYLEAVQLALNDFVVRLQESSARISAATYRPLETVFGQFQGSNNELEIDLAEAFEETKQTVNGIHRRLKPYIQSKMSASYNYCRDQRGKGCYAICKNYMEMHMDESGSSMYTSAEQIMRLALDATSRSLRAKIQCAVEAICDRIGSSYDVVLNAVSVTDEQLVDRATKRVLQSWVLEKLVEYYNNIDIDSKPDTQADERATKAKFSSKNDYDDNDSADDYDGGSGREYDDDDSEDGSSDMEYDGDDSEHGASDIEDDEDSSLRRGP